ncbi:MAG: H-NS histone family protein [Gammaproteobacteria bacterium]|uniref:H-NS histone family protein n=1 Tax=Rhodoferax sp. TaxID=50421 RepID=UPI00179502FF|nr:H-NS histone family protein [Rhodoferax sp.]MBU3897537.1 H-NS histone family protein [Gammaproteobacteria bacterium]MBA3058044.1 H-NS histone family protein [Rhodoferax sp.]MBU3999348.1 H-NS histone family protein [Gammaproteobacteria bacterium]MBU4018884.1 H-NS histone family protein [Gammaproteobacteria bacterium]MBU4079839.1 H-NS histone family protein [Gammaproteobacteria bacterium]
MSDLIEIQSQIEKLQKQATEIKAREFGKTVQEILVKMQAFGITLKDLQPGKARGAKGKGKTIKIAKGSALDKPAGAAKKVAAPVAAKYVGPNGESWSGRGLTPRWLTALLVDGKSREDFAVKS